MENKSIRLLRAEEIECRIGTISEKGLSLLLYKDARADMKILDEVYGSTGWQRKHEMIGGNLYCTVSIWDEDKNQWISKMDVGTESYTEKEKGQASDSFKRACVSLGIGRELYTAPFIWISASKAGIENRNGKLTTYDKFRVSDISYNEGREISSLTIINQNGETVYSFKTKSERSQSVPAKDYAQNGRIEEKHLSPEKLEAVNKELARTGVALDAVLKRYGLASIDDMSDEVYGKAISSLRRTHTKAA